MPEAEKITDLMKRIREGDQDAAAALVKQYEPLIRRMVRLRIEDERLSRVFESMDVCQSVLGSFFVRAAMGQFDVQEPGQLVNLLITMTKNKVASAARKEYRQKRDRRRVSDADSQQLDRVVADADTPSVVLGGQELIDQARARMRDDERQISQLRSAGCSWEEVAEKMGGTAQARRVQFMRTASRIMAELGIDDSDE